KVLSTIVAALVAVSFSGIAFAAEMKSDVKTESTTVTPAGDTKTEKKEVKKSVKAKKGKKVVKKSVKEETTTTPAPAAPAAK
ncbi:MAG: hypothetical protein EHM89_06685, partial [Acidobacteria bacterium]